MRFLAVQLVLFFIVSTSAYDLNFSSQSTHHLYANMISLDTYLQSCLLYNEKCGLSQKEQYLAQQILNEDYGFDEIQIIRPEANGYPFQMGDDQHRMAVTGSQPKSKIFFNSEYFVDEKFGQIDLKTTLAILLHELGHHFGWLDGPTRPLDTFAQKITDFVFSQTQVINLARYNQRHVTVSFFNGVNQDRDPLAIGYPIVIISDGKSLTYFSYEIANQVICPFGYFIVDHIWAEELKIRSVGMYSSKRGEHPLYLEMKTGHYCKIKDENGVIRKGDPILSNGAFRINLKSTHKDLRKSAPVRLAPYSYYNSSTTFQRDDEAALVIDNVSVSRSQVGPKQQFEIKATGKSFLGEVKPLMNLCSGLFTHRSYKARNLFGEKHLLQAPGECSIKLKSRSRFEVKINASFDEMTMPGEYLFHGFDFPTDFRGNRGRQRLKKLFKRPISVTLTNPRFRSQGRDVIFRITNRDQQGRINDPFQRVSENHVLVPTYERVTYEISARNPIFVRSFYLHYEKLMKDGRVIPRTKPFLMRDTFSMTIRLNEGNGRTIHGSSYSWSTEEGREFDLIDRFEYQKAYVYTTTLEEIELDLTSGNYVFEVLRRPFSL